VTKTTEEFFESHTATRRLLDNLKANEDVFCYDMNEEDKKSLMRCNLIMIRQCLEDFGVE
jgi:hypothetical protein